MYIVPIVTTSIRWSSQCTMDSYVYSKYLFGTWSIIQKLCDLIFPFQILFEVNVTLDLIHMMTVMPYWGTLTIWILLTIEVFITMHLSNLIIYITRSKYLQMQKTRLHKIKVSFFKKYFWPEKAHRSCMAISYPRIKIVFKY